ncbi:hypothetical protein ANCCAN_15577 [Ancylostoma caninum]|uniref:ATP-dependent DNA helicase n=1 Tax=Ancylostoma caninum TaxID=29170 RepID=A0A368G2B2_ANCCA|nr:hypothetical protein ANCCAN_15577 [Ancylostoma caninum]
MAHKRALEALDRTLQDIRERNCLMGGVAVLLAGDFRQTLPVIPRFRDRHLQTNLMLASRHRISGDTFKKLR